MLSSLAGTDQSVSRAYLASTLPALATHYGVDISELLVDAGLPENLFASDVGLIPLVDAVRLVLALLARCQDPALGFELGRQVRLRSYQVLGYVIFASPTVADAIDRLIRFEKLSGNLGRTDRQRIEGGLRLSWHCPLTGEAGRFLTEAAITGWVTFARQLVSEPAAPLRVCFRHACYAEPARYQKHFACPVDFTAGFDGVELADTVLALPLTHADPGLGQLMEREARQLLANYDSRTNLPAAVRREVYHLLAEGEPALEQVAIRLGMAERTLQQRLRQQGSSFKELVDGLRRTLAALYLQDKRLSLTDIALLLGFAEQSSFSRAFRRWFGQAPARYRQAGG